MRTFLLVAMLVGSLLPMQTQAAFWDGNKLVTFMREYEKALTVQQRGNRYKAGLYQAYVVSAHDTYDTLRLICTPDNVEIGQVNAVVAAYLKANPTDWHFSAITIVRNALVEAFPCG